jgi:hypothetical protein
MGSSDLGWMKAMSRITLTVSLILAITIGNFNIAYAVSSYTNSFNNFYGTSGTNKGSTLGSCITCHNQSNGNGGTNNYGRDYRNYAHSYATIEQIDSDGDGFTNVEEITTGYFPGNSSSHPAPTNSPPLADAGPAQTVNEGVTVTLDGSNSSDPDDGIASYLWTQTGGPPVTLSNTTVVKPTFTSPNVGVGGVALTFTLTVTDGSGVSRTDSCNVNVTRDNLPPVADAGTDQTVDERITVTLDGRGSSDPDDGIASYLWEQTGGPSVVLSSPTDPQPTFAAPDVGVGGESLTFLLTVTDNGGLRSTDTCIVNVSWVNVPPIADTGPNQTVYEGNTVMLDGVDSNDPDGGQLTYLWEQTGGPSVTLSDVTAVQPNFMTPMVDPAGAMLTFRLTVEDNGGLQSSSNVSISVNDNGITGFPPGVFTFESYSGEPMGIKVESGGHITSLYTVDPSSIGDTAGKPENLMFGLIDLEIKADTPGATAMVTIYFPQQVPEDYAWYQYSSTEGWIDSSDWAEFNLLRDEVTLTLKDGGSGDDDGVTNGFIVDPSGPGTAPLFSSLSIGGNNWGGSGCFIETAGNGFSTESRLLGSAQFKDRSALKKLIGTIFKEEDAAHPAQEPGHLIKYDSLRTVRRWIVSPLDDMGCVVHDQSSRPIIARFVLPFFLLIYSAGVSLTRGASTPGKDLGPNKQ